MITFRLPRPGTKWLSQNTVLFLLWLFLLVFPKGGIKLGGIPLTWGYFLLSGASAVALFRSRQSLHLPRLSAYLIMIPFQIVAFFGFAAYGFEGGFGISFLCNFFFFPWCFFLFLSESIEKLDLPFFLKLFKIGVFLIALYGIFLFFFKMVTGRFIEIPFLTVNFHDLGEMENKNINRGSVFKLISTYNNGNIYGVCLLMLLPLYLFIEERIWRKLTVVSSLILTFSRTAWIGLLFAEFLSRIFASRKIAFLQLAAFSSIVLGTIVAITFYFGFDLSFLIDRDLGGRKEQFQILQDMTLLPSVTFRNITEMVYLSVLANFGLLGLFTFLLCMGGPLIVALSFKSLHLIQKRILCGLVTYLFVSISDAALLFVPVLIFYWFLSSLLLRRSFDDSLSTVRPSPVSFYRRVR